MTYFYRSLFVAWTLPTRAAHCGLSVGGVSTNKRLLRGLIETSRGSVYLPSLSPSGADTALTRASSKRQGISPNTRRTPQNARAAHWEMLPFCFLSACARDNWFLVAFFTKSHKQSFSAFFFRENHLTTDDVVVYISKINLELVSRSACPKTTDRHSPDPRYRWVPFNPNMDNLNSWSIQSPMEMTCKYLMLICRIQTLLCIFKKKFYLVLLFRIKREVPKNAWEPRRPLAQTTGPQKFSVAIIRVSFPSRQDFQLCFHQLSLILTNHRLPPHFYKCCILKGALKSCHSAGKKHQEAIFFIPYVLADKILFEANELCLCVTSRDGYGEVFPLPGTGMREKTREVRVGGWPWRGIPLTPDQFKIVAPGRMDLGRWKKSIHWSVSSFLPVVAVLPATQTESAAKIFMG